jgi:hypothetical protein
MQCLAGDVGWGIWAVSLLESFSQLFPFLSTQVLLRNDAFLSRDYSTFLDNFPLTRIPVWDCQPTLSTFARTFSRSSLLRFTRRQPTFRDRLSLSAKPFCSRHPSIVALSPRQSTAADLPPIKDDHKPNNDQCRRKTLTKKMSLKSPVGPTW